MNRTGECAIKKPTIAVALALCSITAAPIYAQQPTPSPCAAALPCKTSVPEPNSLVLLGSGLFVLGGLLFLARKRFLNN